MLIAGVAACLLGFAASAWAATDTVTSAADSGPGSLRAAIAGAGSGDTVVFASGLDGKTIHLTSGAIGIDKSLTIDGPGALLLTVDAGHSSQIFTVSGGNVSISGLTLANGAAPGGGENEEGKGGAIDDEGSGSLIISDSTFTANTAGEAGGSTDYGDQGQGGAIYKAGGPLTVSDSTLTANTAGGAGGSGEASGAGDGGAIAYRGTGTLTVSGSTFVANTAGGPGGEGEDSGLGSGGAIEGFSGVSVSVSDSTFAANAAGQAGGEGFNSGVGFGGAIKSRPPLTVSDSTFANNAAGGPGGKGDESGSADAGAIEARALTVFGATFTANTAGGTGGVGVGSGTGFGGAIRTEDLPVSIADSTLVGNAAGGSGAEGDGGAILLSVHPSTTLASVTIDANAVGENGRGAAIGGAFHGALSVTAKATIVSGNTGAPNCDAPVASSSYSLEGPSAGDTSCGFDLPSANPLLEPLADNGGPTETQALPASSPAVDAVPAAKCPTSVDQRGEPRPDNGKAFCDVGAYELQDPPVAPTITSAATTTFQVGKSGSFTVTATGLPAPDLSETGALPAGVDFTDNGDGTAKLSGTPAAGTSGSYPIAIEASNSTLPDAEQSFTLTVQAPPTASIATPADGATYMQGQAVDSSFTCAEGADGPGVASCLDRDGHPSGAAIDTATLGKHTLTVTATSKDGLTGRASVTYTVQAPAPAPLAVAIRTARAKVLHATAKVRLACSGGGTASTCSGILSLKSGERVLARARYTIASGKTQPVALRLSGAALGLLERARHHRLRVQATATGGPSAHRAIVLRL